MGIFSSALLSTLPQFIKIPILKIQGHTIGKHVKLGWGAVIHCQDLTIEDHAVIQPLCYIRAQRAHIGKRALVSAFVQISLHTLMLKSQSRVDSFTNISGNRNDPRSSFHMGPASWVFQNCFINVSRRVHLGKNVGIGGYSQIFTHGYWLSQLEGFPISHGEVVLADDVWVPWRCFIMPGVTIGKEAIIGASSVVTRSIPAHAVAAGMPAKVVKTESKTPRSEEEKWAILNEISTDLAVQKGDQLTISESVDRITHSLSGKTLLCVWKTEPLPEALLAPPTLNIIPGTQPLPAWTSALLWSLADGSSSSHQTLPVEIKHWFAVARSRGIRYYPHDEDMQ